jgi:Zn-dependent peptidase ImmA (M78 family)
VASSSALLAGENAALALRQRLALGDDAVDLEAVAAQRDALVFRRPFGDDAPDGMYAFDGEHAVIVVNAAKPPQRQRFTLAHELGHHELHRVRGPTRIVDADVWSTTGPDGVKDPDEVAANAFAAHLLLPRTGIEQTLGSRRNRQVTVDVLVELVQRFRVSWEMACWRLYNERFVRRADREQLLAAPRTATLAAHGIDDRHYALSGPAVPSELALAAARLWASWHITDERLAELLELPVGDALALMDSWDVQHDDRGRRAADLGEQMLAEAGIELTELVANASHLDDEEEDEDVR